MPSHRDYPGVVLMTAQSGATTPAIEPPPGDRLREIRTRAEAATPGPWEVWENNVPMPDTWGVGRPEEVEGVEGDSSALVTDTIWDEDDATFIAHAREDIPYLLSLLAAEPLGDRQRIEATARRMQDWCENGTVHLLGHVPNTWEEDDPEWWIGLAEVALADVISPAPVTPHREREEPK